MRFQLTSRTKVTHCLHYTTVDKSITSFLTKEDAACSNIRKEPNGIQICSITGHKRDKVGITRTKYSVPMMEDLHRKMHSCDFGKNNDKKYAKHAISDTHQPVRQLVIVRVQTAKVWLKLKKIKTKNSWRKWDFPAEKSYISRKV